MHAQRQSAMTASQEGLLRPDVCRTWHAPLILLAQHEPRKSTASSRVHGRGWLGAGMSVLGVRRAKAALSSGCKSHPATAPAGSNRSSYGGNEMAEAFG